MDITLLIKALILGIIEGLTEFLPISSTGHLILAGHLLGFNDDKGKVFEIAIQTGAMLAIVWEYRARFRAAISGFGRRPESTRFITNIVIAFMPAAILGLTFGKLIKAHLFAPVPVAMAFIVGGLIIGIVESLSGFYLPTGFKDVAPYLVVLLMLWFKPNGLFGEKLRKKV